MNYLPPVAAKAVGHVPPMCAHLCYTLPHGSPVPRSSRWPTTRCSRCCEAESARTRRGNGWLRRCDKSCWLAFLCVLNSVAPICLVIFPSSGPSRIGWSVKTLVLVLWRISKSTPTRLGNSCQKFTTPRLSQHLHNPYRFIAVQPVQTYH